ncbi:MAG: fimbria/pilus outer membrane usher protein [Proteobacteria bacterium]|nr:fimbria/pilus outer membrane usher protein [Pseudomonadota bacterium]
MLISLLLCPKFAFAEGKNISDPPQSGSITLLDQKQNPKSSTDQEVLEVYLNSEKKGDFIVIRKADYILFKASDFKSLGFKDIPKAILINGENYISLKALYPAVNYKFDEKKLSVDITAEPKLLSTELIDLTSTREYKVLYPKYNSAFLNYLISYNAGERLKFQDLNIPFEAGIRLRDYLTYSNFSYRKTGDQEKFVRLMSNITRDDRKAMRRVTLGDFIASSGGHLGGSGNIGGINIAKEFSIDPYFIRYPNIIFPGYIQNPSEVELYINGIPVRKERLSPGGFEFLNLPLTNGLQDVELVIKDDSGRVERLKYPFYFAAGILKPGLHDYNYGLGFKREDFRDKNFDYGDPVFLFYHKYGLNSKLTIGVRGEADRDFLNLGPSASFLAGKAGVIEVSAATSISNKRPGWGSSIDYYYNDNKFGGRFMFEYLNREYSNISLESIKEKERFESLLSLSYNLKVIGSLSFMLSEINKYDNPNVLDLTFYFSRNLFRYVNLLLRASQLRQADKNISEIFAGLNFYFGDRNSGGVSYQQDIEKPKDNYKETVYLQRNPPFGEGVGYRFMAESENNDWAKKADGNANVEYRGRYGIYDANYYNFEGKNIYNLTASGGAVFIDKSLFITRPVTDSFSLVKVADLKNVTVNLSSNESGKTNGKGEILVPGLISYYENKISVQDDAIPMNYRIGKTEMFVSPPYRGGGIVKLDIKKIQNLTGHIFLIKDGKKFPAELGKLTMNIDNRLVETVVGKGGEFYIEDVKAGKYELSLIYRGMECIINVVVPESDEMVINVGELLCGIK